MVAHLSQEPNRYVMIGAVCAAFNNLILIGGEAAGLHFVASILLTFILVLPASYFAHAFWTFDVTLSWSAFARFLLGSVSGLCLASFTIGMLCGPLSLPMILAAPLATIIMTVYNYMIARWAIAGHTLNRKR